MERKRDETRRDESCATGDARTQEKHNNLVSRSRIIRRIPTTSSYKINSFRFRFMFCRRSRGESTCSANFLCISLHVSCRALFPSARALFFNSNERDCIICAMWNALEFNAFFGAFVFVMLQLFFFFLSFPLIAQFPSTFYGFFSFTFFHAKLEMHKKKAFQRRRRNLLFFPHLIPSSWFHAKFINICRKNLFWNKTIFFRSFPSVRSPL